MSRYYTNNAVVVGGLGIIGTATRKLFDIKDYWDLKGNSDIFEELAKRKYVFICLPTVPNQDGYDTDAIFDIIQKFEEYPHDERIYILRSTVIPGTADLIMDKLNIRNIVSNPEFLTMRTIDDDTFNPDIVVCGCVNENFALEIGNLYLDHVKTVPQMFITGNKEAEMIKLAINVFYTMKVIFGNQLYDICETLGIKYDVVKNALYARKWIGANHLTVFHDGKRGAGGNCLRKDLQAFNTRFHKPLFEHIEAINDSLLDYKP